MTEKEALAEAFQAICRMDVPLNARLQAYAGMLRELAPKVAQAYDDLVTRLTSAEFGSSAPAVGDQFPPFVLPSSRGGLQSLDALLANGPVVLSFNRGHWCPLCRLELRSLSERKADLERFEAELVSVIPDRQFAALRLAKEAGGDLMVLSDIDNGLALSAGLALWLGEELIGLMRDRGLHLDVFQGNDGWFVPLPATFVIGRQGRVIARNVNPEFWTRMEMDDIIAALAEDERSRRESAPALSASGSGVRA